nr:hypothetical protein [Novosphingobium sp. B1]
MELLDQIETYLAQHRMPPSKFGRLAVGDPRFVEDLRGGRLPRAKTCDRVRSYLVERSAASAQQLLSQGTQSPRFPSHASPH